MNHKHPWAFWGGCFYNAEGVPIPLEDVALEIASIEHAAHMPESYQFNLPTWINNQLYGKLVMLSDADGRPIQRSEDILLILKLLGLVGDLIEALSEADRSTTTFRERYDRLIDQHKKAGKEWPLLP